MLKSRCKVRKKLVLPGPQGERMQRLTKVMATEKTVSKKSRDAASGNVSNFYFEKKKREKRKENPLKVSVLAIRCSTDGFAPPCPY